MIKKTYAKDRKSCRVTFKLPAEVNASQVYLCGEFNGWDEMSHPMRLLKDGSFSRTLTLEPGRSYRFRYRVDGSRWENDWQADDYLPNEFGTEDSIVRV